MRREFIYTTPDEVIDVLKETVGEVVTYTASPTADEYRISSGTTDPTL
jgi:hypothetical protein